MSDENKNTAIQMEVVESNTLMAITKAEIDTQIATAHQFPRSLTKFTKRSVEMATLDEDTAQSCIYARPVGTDRATGKQKFAEGMSVRLAEIVAACYGNIRVGSMLIEQSERQVKARGFAHDLETNYACTSEVVESTVKRDGTPYDERMRVVIAKAALAKAGRDATFKVVPRALCKAAESAARRVAIGDATTLDKRRSQVMEWIGKLGIEKERVFAALGIVGESDIGLNELDTLTGLKTAIKENDATVDEAFPKVLKTSAPVFGGTPTAKEPTNAPPTDAPKSDPQSPKVSKAKKPTLVEKELTKTEKMEEFCKANEIDFKAALEWIGESGIGSFEDYPDDQLKMVFSQPKQFKKTVESMKGGA